MKPCRGHAATERWLGPITGAAEPPVAGQTLSWRTLAAIVGFLCVWRLVILLLSLLWGRIGVANAWPPDIDVMWLWRYSVRWDAGWYLAIVRDGYQYAPDRASTVAFFPGFPLLTSLADRLLPGGAVLAGLVVVHVALAAASVYVFQTVRLDFGERVAWRTLYLLLIYPAAFFFSALYAESLLLLAIAGSLYHARRGQWWRAAAFGVLASATKVVGMLIVVPLAMELYRQRGVSHRRPWPAVAVLLTPIGAVAYFAYLHATFGSFRVFFETESEWHRDAFSPTFFMGLQRLFGDRSPLIYYPANNTALRSAYLLLDTTLIWVFLAAGIFLWLRVRPSYGALVIGMTLLPALSGSPQSMNRYVAVLFPAFILLGRIQNETVRDVIALAFTAGLALTTFLFVQAYWAG